MCGHTLFLAEEFLRKGALLRFPQLETSSTVQNSGERLHEIANELAGLVADRKESLGDVVTSVIRELPLGSVIFILVSVRDETLMSAIGALAP
jgi:hypothetical protein